VVVHAAIGAIQPTLFHHSGIAENRLRELPSAATHAVLGR
jgi:hypothetical protein